MKQLMFVAALALANSASAGDLVGSYMRAVGENYSTATYIDYSEDRWELHECEKFAAFLAGRLRLPDPDALRVFTFVGPINERSFWRETGKLKRDIIDFHFGKGQAILVQAETEPYPFQEFKQPSNFEDMRFFVGLGNPARKPVLCVAALY